MSFYLH